MAKAWGVAAAGPSRAWTGYPGGWISAPGR